MAYSVGGKIEATDFNTFADTGTPNCNDLWNVGAADRGYGQTPALALVSVGNQVFAAGEWADLIQNIIDMANHQGTALGAWINSTPVTGDLIQYEPQLSNNLTLVDTNRLNAAAQGGTTSTTTTSTNTWSDNIVFTFTVTFTSNDHARWFFNAGGQLGVQASHPAGVVYDIDQLISDICAEAGTLWLSSASGAVLAGTTYNGSTKVGGGYPAGETIASGTGFHALGAAPTQLLKQFADFAYHGYTAGSFLQVDGSTNGAGVITMTVTIDAVPTVSPSPPVSTGTAATLIVRPPDTTYLAANWGVPSITNTYTAT